MSLRWVLHIAIFIGSYQSEDNSIQHLVQWSSNKAGEYHENAVASSANRCTAAFDCVRAFKGSLSVDVPVSELTDKKQF